MKIKKDVLVDFLRRATMTGVSVLTEGILDFTDKGIRITSQAANNNVLMSALLKAETIESYEAIGQIGIHSLQDMVKLLDGFIGEYIKFDFKKNQIILSSLKRRVKITLMDKDIIAKPKEYPKNLEKRLEIVIDMDILKGFFKNMGVVNTSEFSFTIKDKELYFNTKGFNEVTEKIDIKEGLKGTNIKLILNKVFIDAIENLTGEVKLKFKSDYPITIVSLTKEFLIKILIAPIVEEAK